MKKQRRSQPRAMKKAYALTEKRLIDLTLSENPLGSSPLLLSAFKKMNFIFSDYPKPNGFILKQALVKKFNFNKENFFIANGSESIIHDLPKIFGEVASEVIVPELSFPLFKISSETAGKRVITCKMTKELEIDLLAILKSVTKKTRIISICNPNNPTGGILKIKRMIKFLDALPKEILVVVDEANIEFGGESLINEVKRRKNLIILRTFSKGFGLADLRIGFAVADEQIIQKLEEETPLFQVSGMSERLASIALTDDDFIAKTKKFVAKQRKLLRNGLEELGFNVFPSATNNIFVKLPKGIEIEEFNEKLKTLGISLVMGENFGKTYQNFFRVGIRSAKINEIFLDKIGRID